MPIISIPSNCNDVLEQTQNCCSIPIPGGISDVVLMEASYYDKTFKGPIANANGNANLEKIAWTAAEAAGKLIVFPNVSGTYNGGEMVEAQGFGLASTRLIGRNHVLTFKTDNVLNNTAFNNALSKKSGKYVVFYVTGNRKLIYDSQQRTTVMAMAKVEEGLATVNLIDYSAKWSNIDLPTEYAAPTYLFDCEDSTEVPFAVQVNEINGSVGPIYVTSSTPLLLPIEVQAILVGAFTGDVVATMGAVPSGWTKTVGSVTLNTGNSHTGNLSITLPTYAGIASGAYEIFILFTSEDPSQSETLQITIIKP